MKKSLFVLLALAVLPALAMPALAAPPPGPPQLPQPKILVIDRGAILQFSKVGQDVGKQIQAYGNQAKADIAGQSRALQNEGQQLQQQVAILAPDVKAQKIKAFENKQAGLQASTQKKEEQIQAGFLKARQTIEQALGPILQGLMQQRGANMILDKNAVVFANSSAFDITQPAIEQLNQKLPALKVDLSAAPAPKK